MGIIASAIDTRSAAFEANAAAMRALIDDLHVVGQWAKQGGDGRARERHRAWPACRAGLRQGRRDHAPISVDQIGLVSREGRGYAARAWSVSTFRNPSWDHSQRQ
jgi:hypothetical protein